MRHVLWFGVSKESVYNPLDCVILPIDLFYIGQLGPLDTQQVSDPQGVPLKEKHGGIMRVFLSDKVNMIFVANQV